MNSATLRPLPAVDFTQANQCLAVLRNLNATDIDETRMTIARLLEGMSLHPPGPEAHLQVLEEMRGTLDFVLDQAAQRYASRPLPPAAADEETLRGVVSLWQAVAGNYTQLGERAATDPILAVHRALLAHRRMHYSTMAMIEYFRARRELPIGMWRTLHAQFATAERNGVADIRVVDALNETWGAQSTRESYVAMLLIDAAGPYSRTPREFGWLVRWAQRFAPYCELQPSFTPEKNSIYGLDTEADHGLRPAGLLLPEAKVRGLVTKKLAAHIHAVVSQLKKGVAAASLGLGEDCVQPACARLLVSLYRPWGLASAGRKFQRRTLRGQVHLCADPLAMAFFLEGREFAQPSDSTRTSFSETQVFRAFGDRVEEAELTGEQLLARAAQKGYVQEAWDVADQSVVGYRLSRQRGDTRLEHRQLVGVRQTSNERMLLAEISWLQYQQNGALYAGVNLMPGPPQVVAVKLLLNDRTARERYRVGFLIPGVQALKTDVTLVVPAGWFLADRRIEVHNGETPWFARLMKLASRGSNFDRVSFIRE
ncbi:MAG TPA: hypothetical protein VFW00_05900 [Rhodocyclaceae bacterium]|nr:hypothetical protein [Rhodocyclaceae bacterium]